MAGGGLPDPDRGNASGGDNNLFDPSTQYQGNPYGDGDGNYNPLQEGILAHTASFRPGDRVWYTPQGGSLQSPGEQIGGTVQNANASGVEVKLDQNDTVIGIPPQLVETALSYINPEDMFNQDTKFLNSPYDSESPPQMDSLVRNAHKGIPDHYDYREGTDEKHCGNCEYFKRGHCSMFKTLVQADKTCNEWEAGPQQKESAVEGHAEDCACPECDKLREGWQEFPPQEHNTGPFPDRVPKPNRFKQDNSFPSLISRATNDREDMNTYSHLPTWDEQIRHQAASLDSCPDCGDGMTDHKGDKVCHSCGTRQPIIYASKTAQFGIEELGAAEGAVGGLDGAKATMSTLAGGVDDIPGAQGANQQSGSKPKEQLQAEQGANLMAGPASQGTTSALANDHLRWALRDFREAGAFGEEEIGGAVKNQGTDDNPAHKGTQGFDEEHGQAPELLKNVNDIGGTKSPALEVYEATIPHLLDLYNQGNDMATHPLFQAVDHMLEAEFPGYRDGDQAMSIEVIDPTAPTPEEQSGEASDQEDDSKQDKSQPENHPKAAAMNPMMPGVTNQFGNGQAMGNPLQSNDPCPVCGLDECPHKRGQQGNAVPNPAMEMANPLQGGQGPYMGSVHEARRPKMCPFHSELVDWSLQLEDPAKALQTIGAHQFGESSCKGGFGGTCNFKPAMVSQSFWDTHDRQLQEQRDLRTQLDTFEPAQMQPDGVPADHDYSPPEPSVRAEAPSTAPIGGDGQRPSSDGQASAVGAPGGMPVAAKWRVGGEFPHEERHLHAVPDEAAAGGTNWQDEMGLPLKEGEDYELKSPNYEVPDHVTVKQLTPDNLHLVIHGEMGMDYGDNISQQDMMNEGYTFAPVMEVGQELPGEEHTDSAPMDQDSAAQVDDLSRAAAMTLYSGDMEKLSPEAQKHFAAIQAMETQGPIFEGDDPDSRAHLDGGGGGMDVDPDTLQKIAGKDFTPREQREFIDEEGEARNLSLLDLSDTHYAPMDFGTVESGFLW